MRTDRRGVDYGGWLHCVGLLGPQWQRLYQALTAMHVQPSCRVQMHRPGVLRVEHWSGTVLGYIDVHKAVWLAEDGESIAA